MTFRTWVSSFPSRVVGATTSSSRAVVSNHIMGMISKNSIKAMIGNIKTSEDRILLSRSTISKRSAFVVQHRSFAVPRKHKKWRSSGYGTTDPHNPVGRDVNDNYVNRHHGKDHDNSINSSNSNNNNTSNRSDLVTPHTLRELAKKCGRQKLWHPFNLRFSATTTPFFPICSKNLRPNVRGKQKRKRGRGYGNGRGVYLRHYKSGDKRSDDPIWGGGTKGFSLWTKLPLWKENVRSREGIKLEQLNLSRLRYFIEKGRLDARYPITQRHLLDSRCVSRCKHGIKLFNVNDYPFPYKIHIEVTSADQSAIDAIRRVGGSVTIVHYDRIGLRAHLKPYKFDILPRNARPSLTRLHFLEKMKSRGCEVKYIKPLWLIREEERIKIELREAVGINGINIMMENNNSVNEQCKRYSVNDSLNERVNEESGKSIAVGL